MSVLLSAVCRGRQLVASRAPKCTAECGRAGGSKGNALLLCPLIVAKAGVVCMMADRIVRLHAAEPTHSRPVTGSVPPVTDLKQQLGKPRLAAAESDAAGRSDHEASSAAAAWPSGMASLMRKLHTCGIMHHQSAEVLAVANVGSSCCSSAS
jgi:hypothetical protein